MITIDDVNTTFIVIQTFWDVLLLLLGSIILSMVLAYLIVVFQDEFSEKDS